MNLLIVESPGKIKKIQSYLGSNWIVKATVGHVSDLPSGDLSIDIENGFKPNYKLTDRGKDVIKGIRPLAKKAETVYLAMDKDREGEAIAFHVKNVLKLKEYKRITFTEITKSAIHEAIKNPTTINMSIVAAQETRRVLDRLVGYKISPAVSKVFDQFGLSAGRVQTPALGIIIVREKEICNFKPQDYFDVFIYFKNGENEWKVKWNSENEDNPECKFDLAIANQAANNKSFSVIDYSITEETLNPKPAFTTSTLMQAASSELKFSAEKTRRLSQTLYEKGFISYIRTDSTTISKEATESIQSWLKKNGYADEANPVVKTHQKINGAQEAHEAIRPTDISLTEISMDNIKDSNDLSLLYQLIWKRTVMSQMKPAVYRVTKVSLKAINTPAESMAFTYSTNSRYRIFDGWLKISKKIDEESQNIPTLCKDQKLTSHHSEIIKCKTKSPPRYTEASLIRKLEKLGIGRPSTYSSIISSLLKRKYIEKKGMKLHATTLGTELFDVIQFCEFSKVEYTSDIEDRLDKISNNKDTYLRVVTDVNNQIDGEIKLLKSVKKTVQ